MINFDYIIKENIKKNLIKIGQKVPEKQMHNLN